MVIHSFNFSVNKLRQHSPKWDVERRRLWRAQLRVRGMVLLLLLELLMVRVQGLVEQQKVLAQTTKVGIGGAGRRRTISISPVAAAAAEQSQERDSQSSL